MYVYSKMTLMYFVYLLSEKEITERFWG